VRQGRAFGIHVLLGSQTLGGAYTLARATLGQMVVRIALQCNEADAYLIMDESNAAPRLLSRPGEGIYNDMAGALEGNSPFQTAWLTDQERELRLNEVRRRADRSGMQRLQPIIFEGNAPAELSENEPLQELLRSKPALAPATPRVWLGAPNAIKGPAEVSFPRQTGSNLLVVGQSMEAALGMPALALVSLAAQFPVGAGRFILIESTAPGTLEREFLDRIVHALCHPVVRPKRSELGQTLAQLARDMTDRTGEEGLVEAPSTFVIIANLQEFKPLRNDDDLAFSMNAPDAPPSPAISLTQLITEGPGRGFHIIATVDTYNNVTRYLARRTLAEFQTRVLFQMSANDSASLIDSPDASKLGLHRALLYNEQEGYLEKFRPYAVTGQSSLEHIARTIGQSKRA
jgi:DNA segregation ATPase FtsK/SpoIIIE-like protein